MRRGFGEPGCASERGAGGRWSRAWCLRPVQRVACGHHLWRCTGGVSGSGVPVASRPPTSVHARAEVTSSSRGGPASKCDLRRCRRRSRRRQRHVQGSHTRSRTGRVNPSPTRDARAAGELSGPCQRTMITNASAVLDSRSTGRSSRRPEKVFRAPSAAAKQSGSSERRHLSETQCPWRGDTVRKKKHGLTQFR